MGLTFFAPESIIGACYWFFYNNRNIKCVEGLESTARRKAPRL